MPLGREGTASFSLICNRETVENNVSWCGEPVVNSFSVKQAKNNTLANVFSGQMYLNRG